MTPMRRFIVPRGISLLLSMFLVGACGDSARPSVVRADDAAIDGDAVASGDTAPACPPRQTICRDGCADLSTDPRHCGDCLVDCTALPGVDPAGARCVAGRCEVRDACEAGRAHCSADPGDGCEARVDTAERCGSCTARCAEPTPVCAPTPGDGGSARYACVSGCAGATPTRCGTSCVDLQRDPTRCGDCGTACPARPNARPTCAAGACGYACDPGFADCDGEAANGCEVTTATSVAHCGACGNVCRGATQAAPACRLGVCGFACSPDFADCDGDASNGCEAATATSTTHCGSCGTSCPAAANALPRCVGGGCRLACAPGFADCNSDTRDGCERATDGDVTACGACGVRCAAPANASAACAAGACTFVCNAGFADCDRVAANGCEVDLRGDALHCGSCARACPARANAVASCTAGACGFACEVGFLNCDDNPANGCEVNGRADALNCGACANACIGATSASGVCTGGTCALACAPGYADCDRIDGNGCEVNAAVSPLNCGTCGTRCPSAPGADPVCRDRVCGIRCQAGLYDCDGQSDNGCESGVACTP